MDQHQSTGSSPLATVEREVQSRSASLKKELGLFDLVLIQVVFVFGTVWVGFAATLGRSQMAFWLIAIVTFYLPLAAVVIYLNRLAPLEGGLYQWAKVAFGDFVAFLVAWNFWIFGILVMSGISLIIKKNIAYAIGPSANRMHENKRWTILVCLLLITAIVAASRRGLALGKWVQNFGGAMLIITVATLILMPLITASHGSLANYHPFSLSLPEINSHNVNVCSKLAVGALSGFEYIAILAGECRAPAKNISRSVWISAPIIALMFILGTASVLAFVTPDKVDLIAPIPQVLSLGFGSSGWVSTLISLTIFGVAAQAPMWLKIAATLGFIASVTGAYYTVLPIIEVQSRFLFAAKIIVVVVIANAIGAAIYAFDKRRARDAGAHA